MSRKRKIAMICTIAIVIAAMAGIGAYSATLLGTQDDPLITLSYLEEILRPELVKQAQETAEKKADELKDSFAESLSKAGKLTAETYTEVGLVSGQLLTGDVGCEIILREGTATATGSLVDTSGGVAAGSGSGISENHLYLVAASGQGVSASSDVTLLVRGSFSVS